MTRTRITAYAFPPRVVVEVEEHSEDPPPIDTTGEARAESVVLRPPVKALARRIPQLPGFYLVAGGRGR